MKVLVTGANGQLGYDICRECVRRGVEYIGAGRAEFDITQEHEIRAFLMAHRPDAVIHCAAWTAVDAAEDQPELVEKVNADGTRSIAAICKEIGAKMIYISTDYVFPGDGEDFRGHLIRTLRG